MEEVGEGAEEVVEVEVRLQTLKMIMRRWIHQMGRKSRMVVCLLGRGRSHMVMANDW